MSRLTRRPEDLVEDVTNLRFKPGVESSAEETELVLVVLRILNS